MEGIGVVPVRSKNTAGSQAARIPGHKARRDFAKSQRRVPAAFTIQPRFAQRGGMPDDRLGPSCP